MSATNRAVSWISAVLAGTSLLACGNPAADVRIDALGPEVDGVPQNGYHRPGQPCILCHSSYGGAEPEMSVAGTVYATAMPYQDATGELIDSPPVNGVQVILYDSEGNSPPTTPVTNCIGNFWVTKDQWNPTFPIYAEIRYDDPDPNVTQVKRAVMGTWIQREGSCNTCHAGDRNQGSVGRIYCVQEPPPDLENFFQPPSASCEGVP
ncbi:MAG TPA: hypothetical protein VLS89_06355 [Candidatus Nanopelagicales bacterium]|nr:hypothetical protein [Candidatus Nanopelagicales bacterium]